MAGKLFEVAFKISGILDGAFGSAIRSAQASLRGLGAAARASNAAMRGGLGGLQSKLANLNQLQAAVARFKDLKRAVLDTQNAFNAANQKTAQLARQYREQQQAAQNLKSRLDSLKASYAAQKGSLPRADLQAMKAEIKSLSQEFKAAEQAAKSIGREFESSKSKGGNLKATLQQQQAALAQLRSQLSNGGISTSGLAQSEARLRQEIEATTRAIERQAQIQSRLSSAQANSNASSFNMSNAASNFSGAMSTAQSIAAPFKAAVDNAMTFEHAMSRVKALTQTQNIREGNLSQVQADMAKLEAQARELGATTQFTMTQAADAMGYLG